MLHYRFVTPADADALLAIYAPYVQKTPITFEFEVPSSETFAERVASICKDRPYLICEEDGVLLGYAYAGPYRARAAYQWDTELSIYLAPDARGRGIGAALYRLLFEILQLMGYRNAYACITWPNDESIGFHHAQGFSDIAIFPNVGHKDGHWYAVAWLGKELPGCWDNPALPKSLSEIRTQAEEILQNA